MDYGQQPQQVYNPAPAFPGWLLIVPPAPGATVPVLSHPTTNVKILGQIAGGTSVEILSQQGPWMHIRLPTGEVGYVAAASTQPQAQPAQPAQLPAVQPPYGMPMNAGYPALPFASPASPQASTSGYIRGFGPGSGKVFGGMSLAVLSVIAFGIGIILSSIALVSCPFYTTDPYSGGCSVVAYPFIGVGVVLTIGGVVGIILTVFVSSRARKL